MRNCDLSRGSGGRAISPEHVSGGNAICSDLSKDVKPLPSEVTEGEKRIRLFGRFRLE